MSSTASALFEFDFTGTDTVSELYIDGLLLSSGTWGGLGSTATNNSKLFSGSGLLNVTVPEPSSTTLLGLGGLGLMLRHRR